MPVTTPRFKVDAVRALGGEVVLHGDSYSDAYAHAVELQRAARLHLRASVRRPGRDRRPGHDRRWRSCASTSGRSTRSSSPIGGGGLIAGVAAYIKAVRPGDQGHRRADDRLRRDDPLARGGRARHARRRRPLLRRRRGQAGRRGDVPPAPRAGRRDRRWSTPTRSAPRSRTSSRTRAASSSRPARWRVAGLKQYVARARHARTRRWSRSPAAPT